MVETMVGETFYALARGSQWVAPPARRLKPAEVAALPRHLGDVTWLPGLRLVASREQAWVTASLEVAEERRRLLACLPGVGAVEVRAVTV